LEEVPKSSSTGKAIKLLPCRTCQQNIQFDPNRKSKTGKLIPLNPDGTAHDCPNKRRGIASAGASSEHQQATTFSGVEGQELRELADKLLREQEHVKTEVRVGLEHVAQRLNALQYELQKLQTQQGRP
jgi:hypothetical protein